MSAQPSPGALRAADRITLGHGPVGKERKTIRRQIAICIDEETHAAELLEAVRLHANQCSEWSSRMALMGNPEESEAYKRDELQARELISKIERTS